MVVFDHSKPTRKNTPIVKVPDPRTLPFSTETQARQGRSRGDSGPGPEAPTHIATKKTACKQQLH